MMGHYTGMDRSSAATAEQSSQSHEYTNISCIRRESFLLVALEAPYFVLPHTHHVLVDGELVAARSQTSV